MRLLAELRDYTELHFSEEEALMERIHYPELPSQKRAHAAFVDRLVNIDLDEMEDLDDNQQVYLLDLIQFLLNWLANHILACDKKLVNICAKIIFLNKQERLYGFSPE